MPGFLVITGSLDHYQPPARGHRVAEITGGERVVIDGGGTFRTRVTRYASTC